MARVAGIARGALHTRHLFLITLLTSAALAYLWGSSNWLPTYLREARGFSLREMGWLASLPQYATVLAVFVGGMLIDKVGRARVPFIFMGASVGVALSVLMAISARDPYVAACCLVAANFFWGLQSPAIPSTVQYCSRPEHTASAFGVTNGAGSLWRIHAGADGRRDRGGVARLGRRGFRRHGRKLGVGLLRGLRAAHRHAGGGVRMRPPAVVARPRALCCIGLRFTAFLSLSKACTFVPSKACTFVLWPPRHSGRCMFPSSA
jgi:hypothetical protein